MKYLRIINIFINYSFELWGDRAGAERVIKVPEKDRIHFARADVVFSPSLRNLNVSALPTIDTNGNFLPHVSAGSPLNTSPNPFEVIS
jgi:hypothetical protein